MSIFFKYIQSVNSFFFYRLFFLSTCVFVFNKGGNFFSSSLNGVSVEFLPGGTMFAGYTTYPLVSFLGVIIVLALLSFSLVEGENSRFSWSKKRQESLPKNIIPLKKTLVGKNLDVFKHGYHLVDPSPWPILTAFSALILTGGGVLYMHSYLNGGFILSFGFLLVIFSSMCWWRDVIRESTFEGHHTSIVQIGLRYGMVLFIISEIMFFLAFFWAFFHSSLVPTIDIGAVWPPLGINTLNPWHVPLLNTLLLLLSGCSVTWSHHAILHGFRKEAVVSLAVTVVLASIFTSLQGLEYITSDFNISDSVYGAIFYLATGFHGLHVLLGTVFLGVCLVRAAKHHFTTTHHFGFEAAAWYWHFVDVVWLFLYISIYVWGSGI